VQLGLNFFWQRRTWRFFWFFSDPAARMAARPTVCLGCPPTLAGLFAEIDNCKRRHLPWDLRRLRRVVGRVLATRVNHDAPLNCSAAHRGQNVVDVRQRPHLHTATQPALCRKLKYRPQILPGANG